VLVFVVVIRVVQAIPALKHRTMKTYG
jgi:hypothetical protein